jgi:hypothetical protein
MIFQVVGAYGTILRRRPHAKAQRRKDGIFDAASPLYTLIRYDSRAKGREGVFVSKRGVILSGTACIQQPLFLSLP